MNIFKSSGMALLAALCLASCGGGGIGLAGGVGSGGSGLAEGTVSGFGSVIIGGVAYGDAQALVERDGEVGVAEAKLGQRVRITHVQGQASHILVLPELIGVTATDANAQGEFLLLGQRVRIVSVNDGKLAPTVLAGLTQVRTGDAVEVHGVWSKENGQSLLLATRIEKLANTPNTPLLSAVVRSRAADRLVLDDGLGTEVRATGVPDGVTAGSLVRMRLDKAIPGAGPWLAQSVSDASPTLAPGQVLSLSTMVSAVDLLSGRLKVQGLDVRLPADLQITPPDPGTAVTLQVSRKGTEWVASQLFIDSGTEKKLVLLKGAIQWNPGAKQIDIRGNAVSLPDGLEAAGCSGLSAGKEVFVLVKAFVRPASSIIEATYMECSASVPEGGVQEASGLLVGIKDNNVVVRVGDGLLVVTRSERSLEPLDLAAWLGTEVFIEYQRMGGSLVLRKLKPR
jgi:hypothetical protein